MDKNLVLNRHKQGLCPICTRPLADDVTEVVEWNQEIITIHKYHLNPKEEKKDCTDGESRGK